MHVRLFFKLKWKYQGGKILFHIETIPICLSREEIQLAQKMYKSLQRLILNRTLTQIRTIQTRAHPTTIPHRTFHIS